MVYDSRYAYFNIISLNRFDVFRCITTSRDITAEATKDMTIRATHMSTLYLNLSMSLCKPNAIT